jgi:hypothetical protein
MQVSVLDLKNATMEVAMNLLFIDSTVNLISLDKVSLIYLIYPVVFDIIEPQFCSKSSTSPKTK